MPKAFEVTVSIRVVAQTSEEAWELVNEHISVATDSLPRHAMKVLEVQEPEEIPEEFN